MKKYALCVLWLVILYIYIYVYPDIVSERCEIFFNKINLGRNYLLL